MSILYSVLSISVALLFLSWCAFPDATGRAVTAVSRGVRSYVKNRKNPDGDLPPSEDEHPAEKVEDRTSVEGAADVPRPAPQEVNTPPGGDLPAVPTMPVGSPMPVSGPGAETPSPVVQSPTLTPVPPSAEGLPPTREEEGYLSRLDPSYWNAHADRHGLGGLTPLTPRLTDSGLTCLLNLSGTKWTTASVANRKDSVAVLLDVTAGTPVQVLPGPTGSVAELAVRSRRATDLMDMMWRPGITSLGVDTVTGKEVHVPVESRLLMAGASGAGKSWSLRPLMARDVVDPDVDPYFLDGKGEEAAMWDGILHIAVEDSEIVSRIEEVYDDMMSRGALMRKNALSVWDVRLGPVKTIYVDEGRVVLSILVRYDKWMAKQGQLDGGNGPDKPVVEKLLDISGMGRSRGIVLNWATQYPVTTGDNPGIDRQMNVNIDDRFCLRVKTKQQAQVVLDDDAWFGPHLIAAAKETRGHGYLGEHLPNLVRTWTVTDNMVRALKPNRRVPISSPSMDSGNDNNVAAVADDNSVVADAAETVVIIQRTVESMRRRAEQGEGPVSRAELHRATASRYRAQVPDLVDTALEYAVRTGVLAEESNGMYMVLR